MNKVEIYGRLVRDVEQVKSKSGIDVGRFTLAVPRKGNKEETDFIDCISFGKLTETLIKYTEKGNRLLVTGSINIRDYEDKDKNKKRSFYIVVDDFYFVDYKKELTK